MEVAVAGFLASIANLFRPHKSRREIKAPAKTVQWLRQRLFRLDPTSLGLVPTESNRVWAIVVETGFPEMIVTLIAIADGTVSLYFSNGGGIIGAGGHAGARSASEALLGCAPAFLAQAQPTTDFPTPTQGNTKFYFLTFDGVFAAEANKDDLGNGNVPLSPLFCKAHDVITQLRLLDEKQNGRRSGHSSPHITQQLLDCATAGDESAVKRLLDAGADPCCADDTGLTPLMAASFMGKEAILPVLMAAGSVINAKDSDGYTALMFACNAGHAACARLLLAHEADVNCRDRTGATPIMFAAQHGYNDVVLLLLDYGADPSCKEKHGLSALGFARQNRFSETERILIEGE